MMIYKKNFILKTNFILKVCSYNFDFKILLYGTGEMPQWSVALTALLGEWVWLPVPKWQLTNIDSSSPVGGAGGGGDTASCFGIHGHQANVVHIYNIQAKHYTHNVNKN